jgi:CO dehydrogenase maturation factor
MTELVEERTGAKPGSFGQIFKLNPRVEDLPEKIAREHNGIKLIVMGGVKTGGSGCACPESALIKALVSHIILERNELVIMDMEAGIEHLGRSTAEAVDLMIIVVEPSLKSIQTAHKIKQLANQIGIKNIKVIANKIRTEEDKKFIKDNLPEMKLLGLLPFANDIIDSGKKGILELNDREVISEINKIKTSIKLFE